MSSIFQVVSVLAAFFMTGLQAAPAPADESVTAPTEVAAPADSQIPEFSTGTLAEADLALFDAAAPYSYGKSGSEITVFEFSDPQCPYCRKIHSDRTLEKIVNASKNRVSLAPAYFPLSFHDGAKEESIAGICYGKLAGKFAFMDYRNKVLSRDSSDSSIYDVVAFAEFAKNYGIDAKKFDSCYRDVSVAKSLDDVMAKATEYGITGTPGYLIVNRANRKYVLVTGAYPLESFVQAVRESVK